MPEGDSKKRTRKPKINGEIKGPELVPQPHGGALNSGGTPGNRGGTGRPPNEIRALAREIGYDAITILKGEVERLKALAATGKPIPVQLVLSINEQMLKYGLGEKHEHTYPQGLPFAGELAALSDEELDARLESAKGRSA